MSSLLGTHSLGSAWKRLRDQWRMLGPAQTAALLLGTLDDRYLRLFDRRYRVQTSGFIQLNTTSFTPARLRDATQYGPANGWAVRRLFRKLKLPTACQFCDLGSGLGRICILAAEHGFSKVTGVELAPELCAKARENIAHCRLSDTQRGRIEILEMDVLNYCATTEDDVFFMFRPFSIEFLVVVLARLADRAQSRQRGLVLIYSERAALNVQHGETIAAHSAYKKQEEIIFWGQKFYVFHCGPIARPTA